MKLARGVVSSLMRCNVRCTRCTNVFSGVQPSYLTPMSCKKWATSMALHSGADDCAACAVYSSESNNEALVTGSWGVSHCVQFASNARLHNIVARLHNATLLSNYMHALSNQAAARTCIAHSRMRRHTMHPCTHIVTEAAAVDHACCPQRVLELRREVQRCQLPGAAAEHSVVQALDGAALLHKQHGSSGSTAAAAAGACR